MYDVFRNNLFRLAKNEEPDFLNMDVLDKFVYLMSNQQRNVIKFLARAVSLRTQCLYNTTS